jgi:hypothetical protein
MRKARAESALVNAILSDDMTVGDLWGHYFVLGGQRTRQELQSYLGLQSGWHASDHDLLLKALVANRR